MFRQAISGIWRHMEAYGGIWRRMEAYGGGCYGQFLGEVMKADSIMKMWMEM
jgi:hypothetical protein